MCLATCCFFLGLGRRRTTRFFLGFLYFRRLFFLVFIDAILRGERFLGLIVFRKGALLMGVLSTFAWGSVS